MKIVRLTGNGPLASVREFAELARIMDLAGLPKEGREASCTEACFKQIANVCGPQGHPPMCLGIRVSDVVKDGAASAQNRKPGDWCTASGAHSGWAFGSSVTGEEQGMADEQTIVTRQPIQPTEKYPPSMEGSLRSRIDVLESQLRDYRANKMTSGQMVYCVICIGQERDDQAVHIFSTPERANEFCAADARVHVAYDYVVDHPERMEQANN